MASLTIALPKGRILEELLPVLSRAGLEPAEDPAISRDAADACAKYVTGPFRYEILEGIDHWVPELAAEQLNALVLEHLAAN